MTTLLDRPRLTVPVHEGDHAIGPDTAPVTLVEYGDYECPFCRAAHGSIKELLPIAGSSVRYVFRHFPLSQIHPHAFQAALAAEAAGAQGRFWEMHDLLYANQDRLELHDLLLYAKALDLDLDRFAADVEERRYEKRVREDFLSGIRSGVNGTPTFFANGIRWNGGYDVPSLLEAIAEAGQESGSPV
jgi:protein-disulfide isomerase